MKILAQLKAKQGELCAIVAVAVFLCLLHWNTINIPLIRDEGEYAYSGWLLGNNIAPYQNSFMQKPPMIIYTYLLAGALSPDSFWPPRALGLLFSFATILLLGLILRKESGGKSALAAMWLLPPMLLFPELGQYTANIEQFVVLPLVLFWALYAYNKFPKKNTVWFVAGLTGAVAFLYKYTVVPIPLFIYLVWLYENYRKAKSIPRIALNCLYSLSGFIAGALLILGYFIVQDGCSSLLDATITFNRFYVSSHQMQLQSLSYMFNLFLANWWMLFLLLAWFVAARPSRCWFYVLLLLVACSCSYGARYGHYYIPLMPFWAAVCGMAVADAGKRLSSAIKIHEGLAFTFLLVLVLATLLLPVKEQLWLSCEAMKAFKLPTQPFNEAVIVARKIRNTTSENDRILVAGSEPEILYYAKRQSSTRFVIFFPLTLLTPLAEKYQAQAIQEIEANPPKEVVVAQCPASWLLTPASRQDIVKHLLKLLSSGAYILKGGYVKEGSIGYWLDELPQDKLSSCSLLLYQKK